MNYPHRGEIFYISRAGAYNEIGSEQYAGRPAIIISNNIINQNSETLEVVYLTTQPKRDLPTHVTVRASGRVSTAICEQVTTVSSTRIGDYYGECSPQELSAVDAAIASSLGLEFVAPENCATESGGSCQHSTRNTSSSAPKKISTNRFTSLRSKSCLRGENKMKTHEIKLSIEFCDDVLSGAKSFEIRNNDRNYQIGDIIKFIPVSSNGLRIHHNVENKEYVITYILSGWGLKEGYVALGITEVKNVW